jgi:metal-responsive CopG/Arc/MetJ family transcriptional regulator
MEVGEKKHCESPDGTELHTAVTEGAVLINAAILVMLCIVCKHSKSLSILLVKGEKNSFKQTYGDIHIIPGIRHWDHLHKEIGPQHDPRALPTKSHHGRNEKLAAITESNKYPLRSRAVRQAPV